MNTTRLIEQDRHQDRIEQADVIMREMRAVVGSDVELASSLLKIATVAREAKERLRRAARGEA